MHERNKALQQWNEQILKEKKSQQETIDKLKYDKFNIMKSFEEDLDKTKEQNEQLRELIVRLEDENQILGQTVECQTRQVEKLTNQKLLLREKEKSF